MRTRSSDPYDFDERTPPPLGTVRDVASRHRCTIQEARRIMGVEDLVDPVPLAELAAGDSFRFNFLVWKKTARKMNHRRHGAMIECYMAGGGSAYIAETKLVEPIDEQDLIDK